MPREQGWRLLAEDQNWRALPNVEFFHPKWGVVTGVHKRDRFGFNETEVWFRLFTL